MAPGAEPTAEGEEGLTPRALRARLLRRPKLAYAAVWTLLYVCVNSTYPLHTEPAISAGDTKTYVAVAEARPFPSQ